MRIVSLIHPKNSYEMELAKMEPRERRSISPHAVTFNGQVLAKYESTTNLNRFNFVQ